MKHGSFLTTLIGALGLACSVHGALEFTDDKSAFYAAHPQLMVEDFESAAVDPNSKQSFNGPLNSHSNNAVFSSGDIRDQVTFRTVEAFTFSMFESSPFVALGTNFAGLISKAIAVNDTRLQTDKIAIIFDQPQTAIGLELSSVDLQSDTFKIASLGISVYSDPSAEDSLIGGAGVAIDSPGGVFRGITSDRPIGLILLSSATAFASPTIDNVAYAIPEPSVAALVCISALILGSNGRTRQKSKRTRVALSD